MQGYAGVAELRGRYEVSLWQDFHRGFCSSVQGFARDADIREGDYALARVCRNVTVLRFLCAGMCHGCRH